MRFRIRKRDGSNAGSTSLLVGLLMVFIFGCALPKSSCEPGSTAAIQTTLFFGLQRPSGVEISDREWQEFVDDVLVVNFSAGFTVLEGNGYWRAESGKTEREQSRVVVVVRPGGLPQGGAIDAVIDDYRRRFQQQSVLRVDEAVCSRF